jgi:YidC/Oxa1 family membrane protein insertase
MSAIWQGLQEILGGTVSFFYNLIPNFGIAVILLTIVIGIFLVPLTLKQTRSMKSMQEIQPEIKRLQRELKTTAGPAGAMMAVQGAYQPAAGCFPDTADAGGSPSGAAVRLTDSPPPWHVIWCARDWQTRQ